MEPLTWTGSFGSFLNPIFLTALTAMIVISFARMAASGQAARVVNAGVAPESDGPILNTSFAFYALLMGVVVWAVAGVFAPGLNGSISGMMGEEPGAMGTIVNIIVMMIPGAALVYAARAMGPNMIGTLGKVALVVTVLMLAAYIVLGMLLGTHSLGIVGGITQQLTPTWLSLIVLFFLSIQYKRRLGLYGKLFDSMIGMIGFGLVMFWVFTGIYASGGMITTFDPVLDVVVSLKNDPPGSVVPDSEGYGYYLLGGDHQARDVFSRAIAGSWIVVQIAPLATLFAFMVGVTLGLPAGFYGGRMDTALSFLANLILAFPVILLFYLLVTPEIVATGIPNYLAVVLFIFPLVFFGVLINSRYYTEPSKRNTLLMIVLGILGWAYLSTVSQEGSKVDLIPAWLDGINIPPGVLVVFVSVVFVNSPTVFRIVRGLTMDVKTRDYVAAAQTRGEGPWYIMLWEILPNVRGPLIVDFCLRVGYTTILLGTLGFFGLGMPPDSPDWGSTINAGRANLLFAVYPPIPPAFGILTLVLGLNLLADGLREESLKD